MATPVPKAPPQVADAPALSPLPAVLQMPAWPVTNAQLATTAPRIFLDNLDGRIASIASRHKADHGASDAEALASLLLFRFQIRGWLGDAELAAEILKKGTQAHPQHGGLHLAHAHWLALFHRFAEAEQALALARKDASVDPGVADKLQRDINLALGRYAALDPDFHEPGKEPPAEFNALAARADAAIMHGDLKLASTLYFEAQAHYHDSAPFPLAWLHTQQGIALLRHGHFAAAAQFFAAARTRLPEYVLASEHLAECLMELGQLDEARAIYLEVIEATANPEFISALSDLEAKAGNAQESSRLRAQALAAYGQLLARHPDAYGQHAAQFFLDIGELERARALADANLRVRQDVGSRLLRADVAHAMGDFQRRDEELMAVKATGLMPPEYVDLLRRSAL